MLKALPSLFPNHLQAGAYSSSSAEFYDKFKREADDYDRDFMKKYDEDLNTTLIFVSFFLHLRRLQCSFGVSGGTGRSVLCSYIGFRRRHSEQTRTGLPRNELHSPQDYRPECHAWERAPTGDDAAFPQWNGPDSTIVHVQAILYSSLSASLLAALIAILGKQWLNRYARVDMRGSIIDRSRDRQRKMNGMVTWKFDLVMECLPLMLQVALLLLGYALSNYLYFINKVVASVIIGFTGFGLLFYLLIVSAATLSYNCPFQTPASLVLRFLIRFDDQHKKYLGKPGKWLRRIFRRKKRQRPNPGGSYRLNRFGAFDGSDLNNHIELRTANPFDRSPPLFNEETDWDGYMLDSNCIAWMFEMSLDADVIMAIMKFIPDVVWHAGIRTTPLERLYGMVVECFDFSNGRPVVIPKLRKKAYLSAKALLHLAIQRKCIGNESDVAIFTSISRLHPVMGSEHQGDSDLESTLGIIDRVFGNFDRMDWQNFSFTVPHHTWMAHILLYRAWDVLGKGEPLPDDIKGFVLHSLRLDPPPPAPIVADCLFIIGLVLGIGFHIDDLLVRDKR
jgi:hypothetical protein